MELVSMVKELLQNVAEHVASYSLGQTVLRYADRTIKIVEKCARWAVPPSLDQDERPQPELVRPLSWPLFLCMLIILRVIRETISFANLIMGKPPLRPADVVIYIQSKRRYLRTLKYQGNRILRARTSTGQPRNTWFTSLRSLLEFTMCFRRYSQQYANNNTTTNITNNDEILVVRRSKRGREDTSPVASSSVDSTMERLIEKMMVDLNNDSDEDSVYTLTDVTSLKNESDQETVVHKTSSATKLNSDIPQNIDSDANLTPAKRTVDSTQETKENLEQKKENSEPKTQIPLAKKENPESKKENTGSNKEITISKKENTVLKKEDPEPKKENLEVMRKNVEPKKYADEIKVEDGKDNASVQQSTLKQETINFIQNEKCHQKVQRLPKNEKIVNGRTVKSVQIRKKGTTTTTHTERRDHSATKTRIPSDNKF